MARGYDSFIRGVGNKEEEVEKVMPYGSEDFWDWLWKILRGKN